MIDVPGFLIASLNISWENGALSALVHPSLNAKKDYRYVLGVKKLLQNEFGIKDVVVEDNIM